MKCPFAAEFSKWIECPHYSKANDNRCRDDETMDISPIGHGGSWCTTMIGKAMLGHKTWIGNDY